jgi:hypothetical protein
VKPELVVLRSRRLEVARHTGQAAERHNVLAVLRIDLVVVLHTVPGVVVLRTVLGVEVHHTGLVVAAHHIGLEEALHTVPVEVVRHNVLEVAALRTVLAEVVHHIDLAAVVRRTGPVVVVRHTDPEVGARHIGLVEDIVDSALVVVDSSPVVEVVRNPEAGVGLGVAVARNPGCRPCFPL